MDNQNTNNNEIQRETIQAAKVYTYTPENNVQQQQPVQQPVVQQQTPTKKKNHLARFFFFIILCMGGVIGYGYYKYDLLIKELEDVCSPIATSEEKELDLDSSLVQDLYNKVKTNIREDLLSTELNEELKFYLAYRQIPSTVYYETDCEDFDDTKMSPYICPKSNFTPKAFKAEYIKIQYENLFGENKNFKYQNIQLGGNCVVGYEYIEKTKEYKEGYCQALYTTTFRVTKELVKATSKDTEIKIKEKVKYSSNEGNPIPEKFKNGTYVHVFKLDQNYNYIYTDKYFEEA